MTKFIIFSFTFLVYFQALSCELAEGDIAIKLHHEALGCEFPEGNKIDCAYFSVSKKSTTRKSSMVFRKGIDWKNYCLTAKDGKRELSPFKEASIKLDCNLEGEEMHFALKIEKAHKECELSL